MNILLAVCRIRNVTRNGHMCKNEKQQTWIHHRDILSHLIIIHAFRISLISFCQSSQTFVSVSAVQRSGRSTRVPCVSGSRMRAPPCSCIFSEWRWSCHHSRARRLHAVWWERSMALERSLDSSDGPEKWSKIFFYTHYCEINFKNTFSVYFIK